jgi:hypothetical protein
MARVTQNPPRTIEDIERRQRELHAVELDAVRTLVVVLRELAIALPSESKLPYELADTAKKLSKAVARYEQTDGGSYLRDVTGNELYALTREIAEEMKRWRPEDES